MRHMSANRQWKVVDERYSGNVFTDDHWYSTHIPRIVRVRTTQTTQKIRKTAQYCANFYAKPSFELLKTWNRVKHRYGEHRRTTAEVPRQKNWWNAQIADVSRKTRNLCVIHAFTRILGSVTGPLHLTLANVTPTWVLPAPDGPHVGPMNIAIRKIYGVLFFPAGCLIKHCKTCYEGQMGTCHHCDEGYYRNPGGLCLGRSSNKWTMHVFSYY